MRIKEQLKCYGTVMVFKNIFVVVPESFGMLHSDKERIIDAAKQIKTYKKKLTDEQHQDRSKLKIQLEC